MRSYLALLCLLLPGLVLAAEPVDMDALLEQVKKAQSERREIDSEREQRFLREKNQQQNKLAAARAALNAAEKKSAALRASYEANQQRMARLDKEIEENAGELKQLAAVFRQFGTDFYTSAQDSLLSAQFPERLEVLKSVATSTRVPDLAELESLWLMLQQEITEGGKVVRYADDVVLPDGGKQKTDMVRIGLFGAISGDRYLDFTPVSEGSEGSGLYVLPRQPGSEARSLAEELSAAREGVAPVMLDPTRGSLLAVLVESPTLVERIQQGGTIGYIIIGGAIAGLLLALAQGAYLVFVGLRVSWQLRNVAQPSESNPLGRVLQVYDPSRNEDIETLELRLSEAVLREVPPLERAQPIIKLLAAVAPLLGLLGTVTGMILTFQAITQFGTGDPKLMAGGISQALMTTVLGLIAAIPLLFANSILTSGSRSLVQILDEQSAGLLARRVEADRGGVA